MKDAEKKENQYGSEGGEALKSGCTDAREVHAVVASSTGQAATGIARLSALLLTFYLISSHLISSHMPLFT